MFLGRPAVRRFSFKVGWQNRVSPLAACARRAARSLNEKVSAIRVVSAIHRRLRHRCRRHRRLSDFDRIPVTRGQKSTHLTFLILGLVIPLIL